MRPPPLAIRARRRVEQRVAAALHEMQGRQYCSVEVIAAHPQMKRPAEERAFSDVILRRRVIIYRAGSRRTVAPFRTLWRREEPSLLPRFVSREQSQACQ